MNKKLIYLMVVLLLCNFNFAEASILVDSPKAVNVNNEYLLDSLEQLLQTSYDGNQLGLQFEIKNISDNDITITYNSGQMYDIVVYDREDNEEVYRWSNGQYFLMVLQNITIKSDESLVFKENWDLKDNDGNVISDGRYEVVFFTGFNVDSEDKYCRLSEQVDIDVKDGKIINMY